MLKRPGREAVVVGAGIGGLAAAVGLRRAGWSVVVLERAERVTEVGAGLSLFPNALAALKALDVGESIHARGTMTDGVGMRTPSGRWLFRMPGLQPGRRPRPVSLLMVHRAVLHEQLYEALPDGLVTAGANVTGVTSGSRAERPTVRYTDDHGEHKITADVIIGADGLRSVTRNCLWPKARPPAHARFTAWRGVTSDVMQLDEGSLTWGAGQSVGLAKLIDGRVYWFATAPVPEGTVFADDHAEALRRFGRWHDPIPGAVGATDPDCVLRHDVYSLPRPFPPFRSGRTALLGDAAHAMTPHLGQGGCLALEDAVVLAAELAANPDDIDTALARYDATRRPRTERVSRLSDQVGRPIEIASPLAVAARNALIRSAPRRILMASMTRSARWIAPLISISEGSKPGYGG